MEGISEEGKAVGLVLDLSLRQDKNGVGLVSGVKKQIISFIGKYFEDDYDAFYLYHPNIVEPTYKIGEHNSSVGNYETDGWIFNLDIVLKQTLFVIASQDIGMRKYIILITDRIQKTKSIEKISFLNSKNMFGVKIILIGIGDFYNANALKNLELNDESINYIHVDNPSDIVDNLLKEKTHVENVHCQTDESSQPIQLSS